MLFGPLLIVSKKGPRVVSRLLQVADILEGEDGSSHLVFRSRVSDQQVY